MQIGHDRREQIRRHRKVTDCDMMAETLQHGGHGFEISEFSRIGIDECGLGQESFQPLAVAVIEFFSQGLAQMRVQFGAGSGTADAEYRHLRRQRAIAVQAEQGRPQHAQG